MIRLTRSPTRSPSPATALLGAGVLALAPALGWGQIADVPREDTLVIAGPSSGQTTFPTSEVANPYLSSVNNTGVVTMFEPLLYYNAFDDTETPWLATGYAWSDDLDEVRVTLREGVAWSDGTPFTADDLVFTIEMLLADAREGAGTLYQSGTVATNVERIEKLGDHEVVFHLEGPRPRFVRSVLSNYFGNGLFVVPRHIWEGEDPTSFANYDAARGWPVTTGPWTLALSSPTQVILDRREDWWAAETGFHEPPAMRRIVGIPFVNTDRGAQLMVTNEADLTMGFPVADVMRAILAQNPAVTTFTDREAPYGSLDWWNIALFFNHQHEDLPEEAVRRAIGLSIDRQMFLQAAYGGANEAAATPFPDYGPMQPFNEIAQGLAERHDMDRYDPEAAAALLEEAGYERDGAGFWARDGERIAFDIDATDPLRVMGVVLQQLLQNEGFDVTATTTPDTATRTMAAQHVVALQGHAGSIDSPIESMRQYHCDNAQPPSSDVRNDAFARWCDARFSELVDEMLSLTEEDADFVERFEEAMDIWYDQAVTIPLNAWYHRIPMNRTYWSNFPTEADPFIQPGFWYRSGQGGLLFLNLEKAAAN